MRPRKGRSAEGERGDVDGGGGREGVRHTCYVGADDQVDVAVGQRVASKGQLAHFNALAAVSTQELLIHCHILSNCSEQAELSVIPPPPHH